MTGHATATEFVLDSDLTAMAGIADWVDALGERYALSDRVQFAAKLCLEESVSNSIRHGYGGQRGGQVRVGFHREESAAVFTVDDDAPRFDPLAQAELPAIGAGMFEPGGQGIRLMRSFASSISYEETQTAAGTGNRLRIAFAITPKL